MLTGGLMILLGIGAAAVSDQYQPAAEETAVEAAAETAAAETTAAVIEPRAAEVRTEESRPADEDIFIPHVVQLNLAYYYPEGADESDTLNSKAGVIFKDLMAKDEAWMSEIYDLSDQTPSQMAARVGRSQESVTGLYNPDDERHDPANPATWTINSFKRVHITFKDGDGNACVGYSNVVPIMSMASVYTWFQDMEDDDAFREYAMEAWNRSHSYSVSVGDVYYCSGCMGENREALELEELLAEDALETQVLNQTADPETEDSNTGETNTGETAEAIPAGETVGTSQTEASAAAEALSTIPEPTAQTGRETEPAEVSEIAGLGGIMAEAAAEISVESSADAISETTAGSGEKNPGPGVMTATASDTAESTAADEIQVMNETTAELPSCPGHVDLYVNARIVGMEENKGLFNIDTIGNDENNISQEGWKGWNTYARYYAASLSRQDWYEKYGFSVSALSFSRNPLSDSEIDTILESLPETLSKERRELIEFALSSVGRVPYYWGGKAGSRDYAGNQFGTVISPDQDGRILKGLDCSGWIAWVYWSVTGTKLPYESTSGLATCGRRIQRYELEPGDIILRTGTNAHVIMFLGWTEDGRIVCVHETTGGTNNVTITERDANWPYYRRIVE